MRRVSDRTRVFLWWKIIIKKRSESNRLAVRAYWYAWPPTTTTTTINMQVPITTSLYFIIIDVYNLICSTNECLTKKQQKIVCGIRVRVYCEDDPFLPSAWFCLVPECYFHLRTNEICPEKYTKSIVSSDRRYWIFTKIIVVDIFSMGPIETVFLYFYSYF